VPPRLSEEVEMGESDAWQALLDVIHEACLSTGSWSGEVRTLRDAIGAKRMGPRIVDRIREGLAEAGYEIEGEPGLDGSLEYESFYAFIAPTGARDLAATVESLLPEIRQWDAVVGDPPWRDHIVATRSVGRWLERRHRSGSSVGSKRDA
jgi:hypothetical protein